MADILYAHKVSNWSQFSVRVGHVANSLRFRQTLIVHRPHEYLLGLNTFDARYWAKMFYELSFSTCCVCKTLFRKNCAVPTAFQLTVRLAVENPLLILELYACMLVDSAYTRLFAFYFMNAAQEQAESKKYI